MNSVELVKKICKERKIPISRLEKDCRFSNGYIRKLQEGKFPSDRLLVIAEYLNLPISYLMTGEEKEESSTYYTNEETAAIAQDIFENKELRVLFDAARDAEPEDLTAVHSMLLALKRKERPNG